MANLLPDVERLSQERHFVWGRELIAQGHTEENGEKVQADRMYEQYLPVILDLNHARNMKKLFRKYGDEGVICYFNAIMEKANETTTSKN